MTSIGARIRKLREEKKISQENMALALNITQSNYGRLEKDDKRLTATKLLKISEILEVSVSFLFNEQVPEVIPQSNNELLNSYTDEKHFQFQTNKEVMTKLIEQYELRLKKKDEIIVLLKQK